MHIQHRQLAGDAVIGVGGMGGLLLMAEGYIFDAMPKARIDQAVIGMSALTEHLGHADLLEAGGDVHGTIHAGILLVCRRLRLIKRFTIRHFQSLSIKVWNRARDTARSPRQRQEFFVENSLGMAKSAIFLDFAQHRTGGGVMYMVAGGRASACSASRISKTVYSDVYHIIIVCRSFAFARNTAFSCPRRVVRAWFEPFGSRRWRSCRIKTRPAAACWPG